MFVALNLLSSEENLAVVREFLSKTESISLARFWVSHDGNEYRDLEDIELFIIRKGISAYYDDEEDAIVVETTDRFKQFDGAFICNVCHELCLTCMGFELHGDKMICHDCLSRKEQIVLESL